MAQKTYQKLRGDNLLAAKLIYTNLKKHKVLSQNRFEEIYAQSRGYSERGRQSGSFHHLYETTQKFLYDHGLMTKEFINGLIVYVATQKCFRTKSFENATKEVQEVTNLDIDKAIEYVTLNGKMVPAEFEGPVVANMLKLEGNTWKYFVASYPNFTEALPEFMEIKYKVVGPVQHLVGDGLIKKV